MPAADFFAALDDLYDRDTNPGGCFVLCVAENRQCVAQMAAKLREVSADASVCDVVTTSYVYVHGPAHARVGATGGLTQPLHRCRYGNMSGLQRFRRAFVGMMQATVVRTELDPDCLFATSGVCAAVNNLAVTLCDPGDLVLVRTAPQCPGAQAPFSAVWRWC